MAQKEEVKKVPLSEFIDLDNEEHVAAFKELVETGSWPQEFYDSISGKVTISEKGHWYVNLLEKAVKHSFFNKEAEECELSYEEVEALKICLNYDDRDGQLGDNFSNGGPKEFADGIFDGNMTQAFELIKILEEKKLGWLDDREGDLNVCVDNNFRPRKVKDEEKIFWLSELGVNTIFDIIEKK